MQEHYYDLNYRKVYNYKFPAATVDAQNPRCCPESELWVTVFGFKPHEVSDVVEHFSRHVGTIVDRKYPPQQYNWIELKFARAYEVGKALKHNGKMVNRSTMVGVMMSPQQKTKVQAGSSPRGLYDPTRPLSMYNSRIYTNWDTDVFGQVEDVPQKSGGLMTRFFELVFGWI